MHPTPSLPQVYVDLDRIRANYRLLARRTVLTPGALHPPDGTHASHAHMPAHWPTLMPVVKADAYGHGHIQVAESLSEEGANWFASGSVQEAVLLRKGLEARATQRSGKTGLVSLLGLVRPEDANLCAAHGVIPLLHCHEQLRLLEEAEHSGKKSVLPVAVKCNTGMSRLGFNEDELPLLRERLKRLALWPVLAVSHLHSADEADGRAQAQTQARVFARFLTALRQDWPGLAASLGNSAGTLLAEDITPLIGAHVCRPGLAIYGCNPFYWTPLEDMGQGLAPAMSVCAPVLATRRLARGDGIGYGHTFKAPRDMPVGIVGVGYADGYARSFSGRGTVCVAGTRAPVIGRVAMQMTAVDLSALEAESGPAPAPCTAWLLGGPCTGAISPEELAALWGTIPYEVFCLLGRNEKIYRPYPEME